MYSMPCFFPSTYQLLEEHLSLLKVNDKIKCFLFLIGHFQIIIWCLRGGNKLVHEFLWMSFNERKIYLPIRLGTTITNIHSYFILS